MHALRVRSLLGYASSKCMHARHPATLLCAAVPEAAAQPPRKCALPPVHLMRPQGPNLCPPAAPARPRPLQAAASSSAASTTRHRSSTRPATRCVCVCGGLGGAGQGGCSNRADGRGRVRPPAGTLRQPADGPLPRRLFPLACSPPPPHAHAHIHTHAHFTPPTHAPGPPLLHARNAPQRNATHAGLQLAAVPGVRRLPHPHRRQDVLPGLVRHGRLGAGHEPRHGHRALHMVRGGEEQPEQSGEQKGCAWVLAGVMR